MSNNLIMSNNLTESKLINFIKEKNIKNKKYIIQYSIILIIISLTLAIIGILDYYYEWTKDTHFLVFLYGLNYSVFTLNLMYLINTTQRMETFSDLNSII